jgi:hypothetical protein
MNALGQTILAVVLAGAAFAAQGLEFERVRADVFAALLGDAAALERARTATERLLADDPNNAPALAVHGLSTVAAASQAFNAGDAGRGLPLLSRGMAEMDRAVDRAPTDGFVRVVRGLFLQAASRQAPPGQGRSMLETAQTDLQHLYDAKAQVLDHLGEHRLGELLQALADVQARLGRSEEAERLYRMLQQKLPDSEYGRRAGEWLLTRQPLPASKTACIGCHVARD